MWSDNTASLIQQAWLLRKQNYEDTIFCAVPGAKNYCNSHYRNTPNCFANISITGSACALRCAHCQGKLLQTMIPAPDPDQLHLIIEQLVGKGCQGVLISGGSNHNGEVPLLPFMGAIKYAKELGLRVLVHGGIIRAETAAGLQAAGVDQVLLDIIGDESTIRGVYHLNRQPKDYLESMQVCREAGLKLAPHVVIGLDFGRIHGEKRALAMISEVEPETLVLVILTPTLGTLMATVNPPVMEDVARIIAEARVLMPEVPLTLGCARPAGEYKRQIEKVAVDCGVNAIAYPDEATVPYARSRGLETRFMEQCCSLVNLSIEKNMLAQSSD